MWFMIVNVYQPPHRGCRQRGHGLGGPLFWNGSDGTAFPRPVGGIGGGGPWDGRGGGPLGA